MKQVLSQYLRTLRERDEFDRLLPELVSEMGYVPLVLPKAGIRQYGVDFPAVGKSPQDGVDELLLFVIKQGNITRGVWSGAPDKVLESMQEVLYTYLDSHVPPEYRSYRKVIVLATTGDLSQDVQLNWSTFAEKHPQAVFRFWGADQVAKLLETHLLNEQLFDDQDRTDLRKSLALAGDSEYRFQDLCRLLRRQLGLSPDGTMTESGQALDRKAIVKALRRIHLAAMVCAYWADAEGERRQSVWVLERTMLWAFHRAQLQQLEQHHDIMDALADIWNSYNRIGHGYYERILEHVQVKDGLSGYVQEGAEYALTVFEQVGLLATLGLSQIAVNPDEVRRQLLADNAQTVGQTLAAFLDSHPASGSPRLDHQVIDVCLGLVLFLATSQEDAARKWLNELAGRLNFAFMTGRRFPVGTDSLDDLVELDAGDADDEFKATLQQTSWLLATVASWCAVLGMDEVYSNLANGHNRSYPTVGAQMWHPADDWRIGWYFGPAHHHAGVTEAPYPLPVQAQELRERIQKFNALGRLKWEENSPARAVGLWAIDFLACRHFRTPVPASMWYRLNRENAVSPSEVEPGAEHSNLVGHAE